MAFSLLESIPNYGDPENIRPEAVYQYANYLATVKKYDQAVELYHRISDHKDVKARLRSTYKNWAVKLTALGEHGKALEIYEKLGEKEQALEALLQGADEQINLGKYEVALSALEKVTNNEKAIDLRKAAQKGSFYLQAMEALDRNDFSTARRLLRRPLRSSTTRVFFLSNLI